MIMTTKMVQLLILQSIFLLISYVASLGFWLETDTISSSSFMKDPEALVSSGKVFKFGFFTPPNSTNRYLGIFYAAVSQNTVIWVANRDKPLKLKDSTVTISKLTGNLVLVGAKSQTVWSTNATTTNTTTTSVKIEDTGNLVLRDDITGSTLWESFSHPSDVYVPYMRISHDINTGKKVIMSSWKNGSDPRVGDFTSGIEVASNNIPQLFIWGKNGRPRWRSGPWNGQILIGIKEMYNHFVIIASVENDSAGTFYFTMPPYDRIFTKVELNSSGSLVQTMWNGASENWDVAWVAPENECDVYGKCGRFGICSARDSPICSCLRGFAAARKEEWESGNWSSGCQRTKPLQCGDIRYSSSSSSSSGDGFFRVKFMKVPDSAKLFWARNGHECRATCLRMSSCSCIAYAYDPNIGCLFWSDSLIDAQKFVGVGTDLYLRLSATELDNRKDKKLFVIIIVLASVSASFFIFIVWCWIIKRKGQKTNVNKILEAGPTFSSNSTAIAHSKMNRR